LRLSEGKTKFQEFAASRLSAAEHVRPNPIKQKLSAGGYARGAMVFECISPGLPQIVKNAGAEFVLYDMEHTGLEFETLKTQLALCRGLELVPMVRVPRGDYHFIARALDIGSLGVMVPMVASRAEAEYCVSCTRYPPLGRRGAAFGFAHDDYQGGDVAGKMAALHLRTLLIAQIETGEGLENVEAIAAVPGIDVLWIGQFDLTNFLGIPAQFGHRDYLAAVDRIVAACARHGKTAAILATDEAWAREYAAKGFRLMAYGIDHLLLQDALRRGLDLVRDALNDAGTNKDRSRE
jgi:2-dehydro-3-deoxyglucarate aldolase/4-hydroxy-2-oxoheptanedioate aldolase